MSDAAQGPGWWRASDQKWYPPQLMPSPPPPPKNRRRKWPYVLLALLVIFFLIIVLIVAGVSKAVKELDAEQASHSITPAQFNAVQLGITHATLRSELDESPENSQEFVTKGVLSSGDIKTSGVLRARARRPVAVAPPDPTDVAVGSQPVGHRSPLVTSRTRRPHAGDRYTWSAWDPPREGGTLVGRSEHAVRPARRPPWPPSRVRFRRSRGGG